MMLRQSCLRLSIRRRLRLAICICLLLAANVQDLIGRIGARYDATTCALINILRASLCERRATPTSIAQRVNLVLCKHILSHHLATFFLSVDEPVVFGCQGLRAHVTAPVTTLMSSSLVE